MEQEIKELNLYDNPDFKVIISSLNTIIQYPSLNTSISNYDFMKDPKKNSILQTFNTLNSIIDAGHIQVDIEEDIPVDDFETFKKNIAEMILEIENSNIPSADKSIFLSIFYDLNKGISLYKINGLNALIDVLKNNICKVKILTNINNDEEYNKANQFLKKSLITIWSWGKKHLKKKFTNILESSTVKLIESIDKNISEWDNDNTEIEE